jgi:hypothetical protein
MSEPERERGPLEDEIYEMVKANGLGDPNVLLAQFQGREDLTHGEWINFLQRATMTHFQALLRLAREIDDLRATS